MRNRIKLLEWSLVLLLIAGLAGLAKLAVAQTNPDAGTNTITLTSPQSVTTIQSLHCTPTPAGAVTCTLIACPGGLPTTPICGISATVTVPVATWLGATGQQMIDTLLAAWHAQQGY